MRAARMDHRQSMRGKLEKAPIKLDFYPSVTGHRNVRMSAAIPADFFIVT
jgi:hypothetical protein